MSPVKKICADCHRIFAPHKKRQARCVACERPRERQRSREKYRRNKEADKYGRPWRAVRKLALERDGHRCRACGTSVDLVVHHRRPLSAGGSNDLSNLETLCRRCHQRAEPR